MDVSSFACLAMIHRVMWVHGVSIDVSVGFNVFNVGLAVGANNSACCKSTAAGSKREIWELTFLFAAWAYSHGQDESQWIL